MAEAKKIPWQRPRYGHDATLAIGDDLVAEADLEIDAGLLESPADCPASTTGCHAPLFRAYSYLRFNHFSSEARDALGVSCAAAGDVPGRGGETCARLVIAKGTTFRLRAVVLDTHPYTPTYWPIVHIEPSCATACTAGEARCAATQTCFSKGYVACRYCEAESEEVCSCRDAEGVKPDGAECFIGTSPDTMVSGTCSAGVCKR